MSDLGNRFKALGTALVSDVLDESGFHSQTLDPGLSFVGPATTICGPAICVRGERAVSTRTTSPTSANLPLYNLPTLALSGAVMVLATTGFRGGGVTGELLATDLQNAGVAGFLTDGFVRDRNALSTLDMPVMAAGFIPTNGARRFQITGWESPICLPGPEGCMVTITPMDWVLADSDGALIIPAHIAAQVIVMAEELARRETALKVTGQSQSAEQRAIARANRMTHMQWLRATETQQ